MLRYRIPLSVMALSGVAAGVLRLMPQPWPQLVWYAIAGLFGGGLACLIQLAATRNSERSTVGWLRWLESQRYAAAFLLIVLALVFIALGLGLPGNDLSDPFLLFGLVYFVAGQAVWLIKLGRLPPSASPGPRAWRILVRGLIVAPTVLFAAWMVAGFLSVYPLGH